MGRHFEGFKLKKYEWSPYWYVIGGKIGRCSTGKTDRTEAEKFRASLVNELEKRQSGSLTVAQALEDYMHEHAQFLPSKDTTMYYSRPIADFFGEMDAESVSAAKVREFTEKQRKELKDGTIRRQLTVLSASLNHARKEGRILSAPFIAMPQGAPAKARFLTKKEAKSLLDSCESDHLWLFVKLAIHTGARKGAILELKWSQVDLKARRIDFNVLGRMQTAKRRSVVPIVDNELLAALRKAAGKGNVIKYNGMPVKDIKKGFKEACDRAGLKNVTPHTLRHTAGTWMAQAGVPIWDISGVLGHSVSTTTELYLKHSPTHLKNAIGSLANNLQTINKSSRKNSQKHVKEC